MLKNGITVPGQGHFIVFCLFIVCFSFFPLFADLTGSDVIVLVNSNSPTSRYIAKLYRQYHSDVTDSQIVYLEGLEDSCGPDAGPSNEILTRQQYNDLIANPVRAYLTDPNHPDRINQIKVIITTAGLPYRIDESNPNYDDVVYENGSNPLMVIYNETVIDAASVESELACLWFVDYGSIPLSSQNRFVNPYQGYRNSPVDQFPRSAPGSKTFNWTAARSQIPTVGRPRIEGARSGYGAINRVLHAGDIYLTCRLDGPKIQGKSPIFAVREMLERANRASNPAIGINPAQAVVMFDDAPNCSNGNINRNRTFNLDDGVDYHVYDPLINQPPDVTTSRIEDDYFSGFSQCTLNDAAESSLNICCVANSWDMWAICDTRENQMLQMDELESLAASDPNRLAQQAIIFLTTYGTNGDESYAEDYLLSGGQGSALCCLTNGAVFTSMESLNAVTMFTDVSTQPVAQGKIVDFITIGGTCAIGHTFEPQTDAAIDNEFMVYNLFADENEDGVADLTFIEAAFSSLPYLSWTEVVIGDPLMRYAYNYNQAETSWQRLPGDVDNDGLVAYSDLWIIRTKLSGVLNSTNPLYFDLYDDLCDIDKDGFITYADIWQAKANLGQHR